LIRTERLLLRPWQPKDFAPYAAMNADPRVRRFFPGILTSEESDAELATFQARFAKEGFGMLAAEFIETGQFAGILGLQTMPYAIAGLPQPAVEIGWRLACEFWGRGLATEGARAVVDYAFTQLRLPSVVAVTTVTNQPSRHVMEKLGMRYRPELDFEHPRVPAGHRFRPHVVYALDAPAIAGSGTIQLPAN
jgi:RimJ/RimL family protein N-acetyltransferase